MDAQRAQEEYIRNECTKAGINAVATPDFEESLPVQQLHTLALAAQSKRVVMMCGEECSGKTWLVAELARRQRRKLVVFPMTEEMETSALIGQWVMTKNNASQVEARFSYSALVQAMQDGHWVLLDNIHLAPSEVVERLNSLAEEEPTLSIYETLPAEMWSRKSGSTCIHPDFRLFATTYVKPMEAMSLAQSFTNRVICIWVAPMDIELHNPSCVLQQTSCYRILKKLVGDDHDDDLKEILRFHMKVSSGGLAGIDAKFISFRLLQQAAASLMNGIGWQEALELVYCRRATVLSVQKKLREAIESEEEEKRRKEAEKRQKEENNALAKTMAEQEAIKAEEEKKGADELRKRLSDIQSTDVWLLDDELYYELAKKRQQLKALLGPNVGPTAPREEDNTTEEEKKKKEDEAFKMDAQDGDNALVNAGCW
jgi:MoxR-like ATPase